MSFRTWAILAVMAIHAITAAVLYYRFRWEATPQQAWRTMLIFLRSDEMQPVWIMWGVACAVLAMVLFRYHTVRRGFPVTTRPAPASTDAA